MGAEDQEQTNKQMQLETQHLLSYLSPGSPENLKRVNKMIDFFEGEYAKNQLEYIKLQQDINIQKINIIKVEEKELEEKIQEQKNAKTQDVQVLKQEENEEKEKLKEQEERSEKAEAKQDQQIQEENDQEKAAPPEGTDALNGTPSESRLLRMKPPGPNQ